jgi:hypothetical protein
MSLYAELKEIAGEDDFVPPGIVPREWFHKRLIGSANAHGEFADIGASDWIAKLRYTLAPLLITLGITDFDASVLQRSGPRLLTQHVSAFVYDEGLDGIRYLSKYGHDIENWALFEPANLSDQLANDIERNDPGLLAAFRMFNLRSG